MDSFPNYNPDDERSYPAAPKGPSGPEGVPLVPDHDPQSGGYVPNDESWAGGAAFPLSSPYTGMSSGEPPAPIFRPELDGPGVARGAFPSRTDVGAPSRPTNRNRILAGLGAFLILVLIAGGIGFVLLGNGNPDHPNANGGTGNGGGGPVVVGTDTPTATPTATPTLLPGQTPLPTAVPPTPLPPGATPPSYASSATVNFTRATQGVASGGSVTVTKGAGDSRLNVVAPHDSASGNASATGLYNAGSQVIFTLTVTNNSGQTQTSFAGTNVPGGGGVSCSTQGAIGLAPGESRAQQCAEARAPEPATTYNYTTTDGTNLNYAGSAPAGGSSPYWYVPSGCGDPTAAQGAAKSALQSKLDGEMGGSTTYLGLQLDGTPYTNYSCSPSAGQTISSGNTFTQTITASGSQAGYFPSGVSDYQKSQVGTTGAGWQLIGSNGCTPSVQGGASLTSANVACQATGTEAWNAFNLGGMAQNIHGQSQGAAKTSLDAVQGVVPGSETFSLSGGSYLPTNASNITFHYSP